MLLDFTEERKEMEEMENWLFENFHAGNFLGDTKKAINLVIDAISKIALTDYKNGDHYFDELLIAIIKKDEEWIKISTEKNIYNMIDTHRTTMELYEGCEG